MSTDTQERVHKVLAANFAGLDSKSPIYKQLSSIDLVSLISYLESEFNISIHAIEYDQSFFETEETIARFVAGKLD
jgi:acyl carrier protein